MSLFLRSLLIAACLCGFGCSALSDFDGYEFSEPGNDGGNDRDDGGGEGGDSGEGGSGGSDTGGSGGSGGDSGEGGSGGGDTGGSGGSGGDTGGSGGSGGSDTGGSGGDGGDAGTPPECTEASDCEDNETCVNEMCVPVRIPSGVLQTAGGGDVTSTNYALRVTIGAPQPMGRASSTNFIVTVGPGAGRP